MITKIAFKKFKGFSDYQATLQRLNLLVGGNNSGKTTLLHALQLVFWCVEKTAVVNGNSVTFRKTQISTVNVVPLFSTRDLFFAQQQRQSSRSTRIELELTTDATPPLKFEIYSAFSRNLIINGREQHISKAEYDLLLKMRPVYIPGTIGITVQEEYVPRVISQQRLITEGRQNQVLRNLILRLRDAGMWDEFVGIVSPLFAIEGMAVPFDHERDEWLSTTYQEGGCQFDIVSAGSGFLQTLNMLSFLFLNESTTALLDEPDSHMHDDLQRAVFNVLDELSRRKKLQILIATHSGTLVDVAGLESVLLIDKTLHEAKRVNNVEALVPLLADHGLSLPPNKVLETLRTRKALFVEGLEDDWEKFVAALGETYHPGFVTQTRGLKIFATGGAEQKWPFDAIKCFEELLGTNLEYLFISDRDYLTDTEILDRAKRAEGEQATLSHLAYRHRESYLLNPAILSRVLTKKWQHASPDITLPEILSVDGIKAFIMNEARQNTSEENAKFVAKHEPSLRGDQDHRTSALQPLYEYFRAAYETPLAKGELPLKLLDAKAILRKFRAKINNAHNISFSDLEICNEYLREEIPSDLTQILDKLLQMFPERDRATVRPRNATIEFIPPDAPMDARRSEGEQTRLDI